MTISILYVDDHEVFHECIRNFFAQQDDMEIIATATNGRSAVRLTDELRPDVVVMDITLPHLNGIEATRHILSTKPDTKVIGLSAHSDSHTILEMLKAGAHGYLVKDSTFTELLQAIRTVFKGKRYLSPNITSIVVDDYLHLSEGSAQSVYSALSAREKEVLQLIAEGQSTKDIAQILNLSLKTIETHRGNLMRKLQADNVAELVKYAIREGLIKI